MDHDEDMFLFFLLESYVIIHYNKRLTGYNLAEGKKFLQLTAELV